MMVNNTNNIKKTMYLRLTSTWSSNYISPQAEAGTTHFSVALAFNHVFIALVLPNLLFFASCFVHHCLYFFFLSLYCLSFFFWFTASDYPFVLFSWKNDFLLALMIIDWAHIVMSLPSVIKLDEHDFAQKWCSIRVVRGSCFIYVICIHLRILMSNIISISDYVRVV